MPTRTHHGPDAERCPQHRASRRSETGFTLVEILVVLVLVGILLAVGLTSLTSIRRSSADNSYKAAASTLWRGIGSFRIDNQGALPTHAELGDGGSDFTNLAGVRYVKQWPTDPATGTALRIRSMTDARAPTTGPASTVGYAVRGNAGWLAAWGHDGRLIFLRAIQQGTTEAPVG